MRISLLASPRGRPPLPSVARDEIPSLVWWPLVGAAPVFLHSHKEQGEEVLCEEAWPPPPNPGAQVPQTRASGSFSAQACESGKRAKWVPGGSR